MRWLRAARVGPSGGGPSGGRPRGFTLLEVMVAVAILGLGLTAILSAQAGAFSSATHARNLSVATGLARCKMTELEERIVKEGLPALDENDSGPCCEGDESPIQCSWRIEKPEFPEPKYGELNLDTDIGSADMGSLGAIGALGQAGQPGAAPLGGGKLGDVAQSLLGAQGSPPGGPPAGGEGAAPSGADGILGTLMGMVYPDVKSIFEASARRLTVKVSWKEGSREREIEVVQWVTVPQMGVQPDPPSDPDDTTSGSSSSGGPNSTPGGGK